MLVLLKFEENRRIKNGNPDQQARAAFRFVQETYNDAAADHETYCYDPTANYAEELDFIDGAVDPVRIQEIASNWNGLIQQEFTDALQNLIDKTPVHHRGDKQYLQAPSLVIYEMKKAAMALDNHFYDCADKALLVTQTEYFTTILTGSERSDIIAHPENYATIQIAIKS